MISMENWVTIRILKYIKLKGYSGSQYALYAYSREILKPIHQDVSKSSFNHFITYYALLCYNLILKLA